jgi:hypothetical protein
MNTNKTAEILPPWLTPWQRRLLVIAGAFAGAAVVTLLLRWLEARRAARLAAEQSDAGES